MKQTHYFEKKTNIQSSISINDEMKDYENTSEEISCQHDNIMGGNN